MNTDTGEVSRIKNDDDMLEITRDVIEVTPMRTIDDDWEYIDLKGHLHRWQNNKLPSLRKVIDSLADEEYPESSHMICKHCGQTINPGYKEPDAREYIQGLGHYRINGIDVTKEQFEKRLQTK